MTDDAQNVTGYLARINNIGEVNFILLVIIFDHLSRVVEVLILARLPLR